MIKKKDGLTNEERLLKVFDGKEAVSFSRKELKELSGISSDGTFTSCLKNLCFFEYIKKIDNIYSRTSKIYDRRERRTQNSHSHVNHEIILNKVFTGSFLIYNIGHELINFMIADDQKRYVYLNPWGQKNSDYDDPKYVFHIIESSNKEEKRTFELVAISEIDDTAKTFYNKKDKKMEKDHCPTFRGQTFYDIFHTGEDKNTLAHIYTYVAKKLYKPADGKRVIIRINKDAASIKKENDVITIDLMANPQHHIAYANSTGKATATAQPNPKTDLDVLNELITRESDFIVEEKNNIDIDTIDSEQCLAVICDRTRLEDSMSNQIAYFLQRDKNLLFIFLHDFLGVKTINKSEKFEIIRERESSIDLLFKSKEHIIVVENKIDSCINGIVTAINNDGLEESQLSKYYQYIEKKYKNVGKKAYFILAPEYNGISQTILAGKYVNGTDYKLKTYNDLYLCLKNAIYSPNGKNEQSEFLFEQFKKSIEYLTWSLSQQRQRTAFIRLKQRLIELNDSN